MDSLSPRERVFLALSHHDTDRVPVDLTATPEAWERLKRHLGIYDEEGVLRYLGVDLRHLRQAYVGPPLPRFGDGSWTDVWGVRRRPVPHPGGGVYQEIIRHPLSQLQHANELAEYSWPKSEWWDPEAVVQQIYVLDAGTPYALTLPEFGDPGGIFEISWYMRGMEQFFVDLLRQPDIADGIMRRVTDFFMGTLERIMKMAGERIDLVWTSDDIAHQHGPLISMSAWRELIAPHHERLHRRVHELGARTMFHSCGAVRPFIASLLTIGVDVLDVLQTSADGMDPREIKEAFGDRLCFHGGIDVQTTLPFGTEAEVRRVTRERMDVLGRNGGYILAPSHNVQSDTPPQNLVAMCAEAGSLSTER
ncbi:MAG TPA: uroporphyrinogen decarboxylase family protein [Acidobacteriota bacterium]|nr:uroporphyrinogen decarboxylase family protein [Acidobacteriota bacterium]